MLKIKRFPQCKPSGNYRLWATIEVLGEYCDKTYTRLTTVTIITDSNSKKQAELNLVKYGSDLVSKDNPWLQITHARLIGGFSVEGLNGHTVWFD